MPSMLLLMIVYGTIIYIKAFPMVSNIIALCRNRMRFKGSFSVCQLPLTCGSDYIYMRY